MSVVLARTGVSQKKIASLNFAKTAAQRPLAQRVCPCAMAALGAVLCTTSAHASVAATIGLDAERPSRLPAAPSAWVPCTRVHSSMAWPRTLRPLRPALRPSLRPAEPGARLAPASGAHQLSSTGGGADSTSRARRPAEAGAARKEPGLVNKAVYQDALKCVRLAWHRRHRRVLDEGFSDTERYLMEQGIAFERDFLSLNYTRGSTVVSVDLQRAARETKALMAKIEAEEEAASPADASPSRGDGDGAGHHFFRSGEAAPEAGQGPGRRGPSAIFQATFVSGGVVAKADVIEYMGGGEWDVAHILKSLPYNISMHSKYYRALTLRIFAGGSQVLRRTARRRLPPRPILHCVRGHTRRSLLPCTCQSKTSSTCPFFFGPFLPVFCWWPHAQLSSPPLSFFFFTVLMTSRADLFCLVGFFFAFSSLSL